MGTIGPEQGEGDRRDARVSFVPDGRPRVGSKARGGDMVRDVPESRNIRDTSVARDIGQQPFARLSPVSFTGADAVMWLCACSGGAPQQPATINAVAAAVTTSVLIESPTHERPARRLRLQAIRRRR